MMRQSSSLRILVVMILLTSRLESWLHLRRTSLSVAANKSTIFLSTGRVFMSTCALGFDGGCFSVLLWLLSVVVIGLGLDIPHLSLYSLILEHHTVFMNKMRRGKLNLPTEDLEAEMFDYIIQELENNGFEHYEISNFTKPGMESRHNLMYWNTDIDTLWRGCFSSGAKNYKGCAHSHTFHMPVFWRLGYIRVQSVYFTCWNV